MLTYVYLLYMLLYNLAQLDFASMINCFGDRKINANWLKQEVNILTHISTNPNNDTAPDFFLTSFCGCNNGKICDTVDASLFNFCGRKVFS